MSERRPERPRDPVQLAKLIVDIATGEADDEVNSLIQRTSHRTNTDKATTKYSSKYF
jgi:hypothetical protein